jgi:nucleotide-binding universal stress UspA family protein
MSCFQNVLVGIDLTHCERLEVAALGSLAHDTFHLARWLVQRTPGRLTLFSALNEHNPVWDLFDPEHRAVLSRDVRQSAHRVLQELAGQVPRADAVRTVLAPGPGWSEIVQQVVRGQHDLVVVGGRATRGFRRALFGSTSLRLLRSCPCPVWVVHRRMENGPRRILVATDLSPAADEALRLGVVLTHLARGIHLHVLHAIEYPLDRIWSTGVPEAWDEAYRENLRSRAGKAIRQRLRLAGQAASDSNVTIHLADQTGLPDDAILQAIRERDIDLLVLGTAARSGLAHAVLGSTAERLLPEVPCSVLVVKAPSPPCPSFRN